MTEHAPHPATIPGYIDDKDSHLTRLRRIEGQVRGLQRMVEADTYCIDILTQISAATKALEQTGFKLVAAGLTYCLANPEAAEASGYPIEVVEKMFMKLA